MGEGRGRKGKGEEKKRKKKDKNSEGIEKVVKRCNMKLTYGGKLKRKNESKQRKET